MIAGKALPLVPLTGVIAIDIAIGGLEATPEEALIGPALIGPAVGVDHGVPTVLPLSQNLRK